MKRLIAAFAACSAFIAHDASAAADVVPVESDGGYAVLKLDSTSCLASIREKATGRELVVNACTGWGLLTTANGRSP